MALEDEVVQAAAAAGVFAAPGERVEAVLAAEPAGGDRAYLCAFSDDAGRTWLVLDAAGAGVASRATVRDVVSITALCEVAEELAGVEPHLRVASPRYLDEIGSPELAGALDAIEALTAEVEAAYKLELT
jgi:hypothetical protein